MLRLGFFLLLVAVSHASDFAALLKSEWEYTMEQSPTWASQLGDRRWNGRWPDASLAAFDAQEKHRAALIQKLRGITRDSLPANERLSYDLFLYETGLAMDEFAMKMHLAAITHRDGIHLADDLADALRFESAKDYEDWIARIRAFPKYMDDTLALLRAGAKAGRVWPRVVMQRAVPQIAKQIVENSSESPFFKPFAKFHEGVPVADRERLARDAKTAITEHVVPAYRRMREFFEKEYLPACPDEVGAWALPDGAKLYELAIRKYTTTRMTAEEIHTLGLREVERITKAMDRIIAQVGFKERAWNSLSISAATRSFTARRPRSCSPRTAPLQSASIPICPAVQKRCRECRTALSRFRIKSPRIRQPHTTASRAGTARGRAPIS